MFDGQKDIIYETLNPYLSSLDDRIFDMTSKERVRSHSLSIAL